MKCVKDLEQRPKPKSEVEVVIDIIEEAMDKVVENYDRRASGNENLMDFTNNQLKNVLDNLLRVTKGTVAKEMTEYP